MNPTSNLETASSILNIDDVAPQSEPRRSNYIPGLDGIRAIAVLLVFAAHSNLGDIIPGGFGVCIFFFLSGFLICTLLLREWAASGKIDLKSFYIRRCLRILPPMYLAILFLIVVVLLGLRTMPIAPMAIVANAFFFTNYYGIYLQTPHMGLGVLWSLAVEEHFYLIFPLLLIFMQKRWSPSRSTLAILAFCILELIWRVYLLRFGNASFSRTYSASDTRMESIAWGCLLAFLIERDVFPKVLRFLETNGAFAVGIGMLLATFVFRSFFFRESIRYTLQGIAFLPLFASVVAKRSTGVFSFLEWGPLRFLGRVSYSFYLIHYTVQGSLYERYRLPWFLLIPVGFALSLALSAAILYAVERPILGWRARNGF